MKKLLNIIGALFLGFAFVGIGGTIVYAEIWAWQYVNHPLWWFCNGVLSFYIAAFFINMPD